MNLEHVNNLIQSENDRHQRNLNKIDSDKCREKERHQKQIEFLNRQKQIATKLNAGANKNEIFSQTDIKILLMKLNEVLKQI